MASRESAEDRVARLKAAIAKVESDLDLALKVEQEAAKVAEPASTHSARPISPPLSDDGESVRPWNDGDSVLPPESTSKQRTRVRTGKRATRTTRSPAQSRRRRPRPRRSRLANVGSSSMGNHSANASEKSLPVTPIKRETSRLRSLKKKVSKVEHKLDRAMTLSMELQRNDGYHPLLSRGSSGRQLKTADESILSDGNSFVDTVKESIHSITFPGPGEEASRPPLFRSPSTGEMIVEDLGRQMQMVKGVMKAQRPKYGDFTEDKEQWSSFSKRRAPTNNNSEAFGATYLGPRKSTAPRLAGGPRPCLSEPTPEAPPLQQGQFTSMGNMAESTKRSATISDFGTLTRDDRRHVFISEAACVAQPRDRMGPGPGSHDLPSSLLEQPQSTKRSAPTPKFTTLSRPHMRCLHSERGGRAHVTPLGRNPSTQSVFFYTTVERDDPLLGPQLSSMGDSVWRPAAPSYSIGGTTQRSDVVPRHTFSSPGPVYNLPSSFGKGRTAAVLRKSTTPKPKPAPGPRYSAAVSSMGRQAVSRSRSNPSFGFSKSKRQTILR